MIDFPTRVAGWVGGLLFVAAVLGGTWADGYYRGKAASDRRHAEAAAAIDRQVADERAEDARRAMRMQDRIDELRARPERVRTVTREVVKHVVADAECSSLPESVRRLWDAGRADRAPAGPGGVGDAGVPGLAGAGR